MLAPIIVAARYSWGQMAGLSDPLTSADVYLARYSASILDLHHHHRIHTTTRSSPQQ